VIAEDPPDDPAADLHRTGKLPSRVHIDDPARNALDDHAPIKACCRWDWQGWADRAMNWPQRGTRWHKNEALTSSRFSGLLLRLFAPLRGKMAFLEMAKPLAN